MCDLLARVTADVQRHGLLRDGSAVVVGVSGGPDSVCLLHLLTRLAATLRSDLHLCVAHLNHQLRGVEADADAQFVADLAARWNLPYVAGRVDVAALAARPGFSLEEAGRQARYAFLADVARATGSNAIAVGHNADDQAETVLMHFLRGSGVAGLRGMLPVTDLAEYRLAGAPHPSTGGISSSVLVRSPAQDAAGDGPATAGRATAGSPCRLVRPLLSIPRADILAYCASQGLAYRLDRSNEDTTYYRNRLRHELLPLLETYNPALRAVLTHTAEVMAGDHEVLAAELDRAWAGVVLAPAVSTGVVSTGVETDEVQFDLARWRALPLGLQRGLVREAVHRLRHSLRNINWQHVERAVRLGREGQPGQAATLAAGLELQLGADRLRIAAEGTAWPAEAHTPQIAAAHSLAAPGVTRLPGGWQVVVTGLARPALPPGFAANADPWRAWLDADAVGPALTLRPRVPGERIQPQGMGGHSVRLNELMINLKVPQAARARWPILAGKAHIAWACGLRLDERAAVRPDTGAVWQVEFERV